MSYCLYDTGKPGMSIFHPPNSDDVPYSTLTLRLGPPSDAGKILRAKKGTFPFSITESTYYVGTCQPLGDVWLAFIKAQDHDQDEDDLPYDPLDLDEQSKDASTSKFRSALLPHNRTIVTNLIDAILTKQGSVSPSSFSCRSLLTVVIPISTSLQNPCFKSWVVFARTWPLF